jgi:hypothetical protein
MIEELMIQNARTEIMKRKVGGISVGLDVEISSRISLGMSEM